MQGEAVAIDSAGNIYVIGNDNNYHLHIIKYKSAGAIIWSRDRDISIGGTHTYAASDKNGNLYFSFDYGSDHFLLVKYDSSGNHIWDNSYYTGGYNTHTEGIALDSYGNIFLTGESVLNSSYMFTIKYNQQGDTLWTKKYNYNNGGSVPNYIFVDKTGNVYVTGISWGDGNIDYATIKYNNNGVQQWVARYNGPHNSADYANCVKVDDEGYCYVTGGVSYSASNLAFCTIKYTPNGDSLWTRLYIPQLTNVYEYGIDLMIDEYKNIYVTGGGADTNYAGSKIEGDRLIKYDRNGNILFNFIDTNAGGGGGIPISICEFNENIYLTTSALHTQDIYTVSYDMTTGNRIFYSLYPGNNISGNPYSSNKILSYKNEFLLMFGVTLVQFLNVDSSIIIKYSNITGINNIISEIPDRYKLFQNYPNPFNPTTKIKFDIPALNYPLGSRSSLLNPINRVGAGGMTVLKVYDILGKEIETLVNEKLNPGTYEVTFNASQYPSGVYFYRLQAGDYNESKKMLLIK